MHTSSLVPTLQRRSEPIKLRNYGRIIQDLVEYAVTIEDTQRQRDAVIFIAKCMRQKNLIWNKDVESGVARLREDIDTLSSGRLDASFPELEAILMRGNNEPQQEKKRSKRQAKKF